MDNIDMYKKTMWFFVGLLIALLFFIFAFRIPKNKKNTQLNIEESYCIYRGGIIQGSFCQSDEKQYPLIDFYIQSLNRDEGLEKRDIKFNNISQ